MIDSAWLRQRASRRRYARRVPVTSARDVASELRRRIPGLPVKKLHKLLYYCQGHHLAAFGEPLFDETVSAFDMGPVVGALWWAEKEHGAAPPSDTPELPEGALNTIGYTVSVYGALNGKQLELLTHNESPWQLADQQRRQQHEPRATITLESMVAYFRRPPSDEIDDVLLPDESELARWLAAAPTRAAQNPRRDSVEELRRQIHLGV